MADGENASALSPLGSACATDGGERRREEQAISSVINNESSNGSPSSSALSLVALHANCFQPPRSPPAQQQQRCRVETG